MKRKYILIPLLALLLAGCETNTSSSSSDSSSSSEDASSSSSSADDSSNLLIDNEKHSGYLKVPGGENLDNRALDENSGLTALNSLGDQKLLIVPVVFEDRTEKATEANRQVIDKVFFGEANETGWESVASFYEKSSFGRLSLSGEVTEYFYSDYTTTEFVNLEVHKDQDFGNPDNYWDQTHYIIRDIYEYLDADLLKEYDQDKDGHVDALWMVYMNNYVPGVSNNPFWAYKFYWNQEPNKTKPTPNTYAWASFDFAEDGKGYSIADGKLDAHTYIHETGHLFGLNDYYDYTSTTAPAGKIDMMDNNVIDHNAYSKYLLNWVEPYHVTGNADITLRPAESSGDFILIKDDWNGHAYDNYLLIEYYTPTGLNEKDAVEGYQSSEATTKGFTRAGVRMWHVDSRLVKITYNEDYTNATYEFVDDLEDADDYSYSTIGPGNSPDRRVISENFTQLHYLDAGGRTGDNSWFNNINRTPGNGSLFKEYQIINASDWGVYFQNNPKNGVRPATFNDGTEVGYTVQIGKMTENGVDIKIRKAN